MIVVKRVALIFLVVGIVGWSFPEIDSGLLSWLELPNSEPSGIAIDGDGNIYCASGFYRRIQKYDSDGEFIRTFHIKGGIGLKSDFGFYIDEDDRLCVHVSKNANQMEYTHQVTLYDQNGNQIESKVTTNTERKSSNRMKNHVVDSKGNLFVFKGCLFPCVIEQIPEGEEKVIISTPIYVWFFQGPFPAFAFFFISLSVILYYKLKAPKTHFFRKAI